MALTGSARFLLQRWRRQLRVRPSPGPSRSVTGTGKLTAHLHPRSLRLGHLAEPVTVPRQLSILQVSRRRLESPTTVQGEAQASRCIVTTSAAADDSVPHHDRCHLTDRPRRFQFLSFYLDSGSSRVGSSTSISTQARRELLQSRLRLSSSVRGRWNPQTSSFYS